MSHPFLFITGYARFAVADTEAAALIELCGALSVPCRSDGFGRARDDGSRDAFFICSSASFPRLLRVAERRRIKIFSVERRGLPTLLSSHLLSLDRLGITVGLCLSIFTVIFSSSRIWDVRIEGNSRLTDGQVISLLEKNGLSVGMKKQDLCSSATENKVLTSSDDIAWISINLRGTVATVEVKESIDVSEPQKLTASNLVSNANGIIERFEEIKGNLAVSLGEPISEGQLLVGGIYDSSAFSGMRYTQARGKVFARCEKDFHIEIPLTYEKKTYTGAKKTKKSLIFFKKEVNFFGNSRNSYPKCDKIITDRYFDLFGLGSLPFGIRTATYLEYNTESATRDVSVAMEQALFELSEQISKSSPECELIRKTVSTEITDTALILDCHVVCVQNVAVEREIEIDVLK